MENKGKGRPREGGISKGGNDVGGKTSNKNQPQGKSGKPCREIYRPPSLRIKPKISSIGSGNVPGAIDVPENISYNNESVDKPKTGLSSNSTLSSTAQRSTNEPSSSSDKNFQFTNKTPELVTQGNAQSSKLSIPNSSPMINRHPGFSFNSPNSNQNLIRSLNVNAKEFQFVPPPPTNHHQQQLQNQQLAQLLSQLDPKFYNETAAALLASSGIYSLQQSKSLGNNVNLLLQQQQQVQQAATNNARQQGYPFSSAPFLQNQSQGTFGLAGGGQNYLNNPQLQQQQRSPFMSRKELTGQFNRLVQSKSSGSIPAAEGVNFGRPRVRFDDEDSDDEEEAFAYKYTVNNAENAFASMRLNEGYQTAPQLVGNKPIKKSRTGFFLNMYNSPESPPSPSKMQTGPNYPQQITGILKQTFNQQIVKPHPSQQISNVKRSRSFGSGSVIQINRPLLPMPSHSVYTDFEISKWPRRVQEAVTEAVTAVERVAARQRIEMVNMIFEATLDSYDLADRDGKTDDITNDLGINSDPMQKNDDNEEDSSDLTTAAVHIFLYFIQRERDRTVMESLLNTCFATFQKLFGNHSSPHAVNDVETSEVLANKSSIFLKFLSTIYTQVKNIRRQNCKQTGHVNMDEMSFTLLALLCDSCLATLRSRLSNETSLMGCLFTVMTSQGRDMESTFPLKMKQLLAAVRDALLGLGPYAKGPLSPLVQKTLMQLIELHAANWALPASAVRYYYSSKSNKGGGGSSNISKVNLAHKDCLESSAVRL